MILCRPNSCHFREDADPESEVAKDGPLFYTPDSLFERLHDAMVSVPKVNPGDSVWWHPDMIHRLWMGPKLNMPTSILTA